MENIEQEIIQSLQSAFHLDIDWHGNRVLLVKYFESGSWTKCSFADYLHRIQKNHNGLMPPFQQKLF